MYKDMYMDYTIHTSAYKLQVVFLGLLLAF